MISYVYLFLAIAFELVATVFLKSTEGFTKLYPTVCCIVLYIVCFGCLSKALLNLNLGIAYATWCGVGIVVSSFVSVLIFKQNISSIGVLGICLIVIGCVLLNLFGNTH